MGGDEAWEFSKVTIEVQHENTTGMMITHRWAPSEVFAGLVCWMRDLEFDGNNLIGTSTSFKSTSILMHKRCVGSTTIRPSQGIPE